MAIYTVHAPPDTHSLEAAERMAFVKDGFAWPALFIPIIWLLWRRLWLGLLVYVLLILAVMVLAEYVGEPVTTIVAILGSILFAWEANDFRRAKLARRGWREVGAAAGRHLSEAESN